MGDIPAWVNGAFQGALGGLNNQFAYCEQMWGLCAPQPQACAFTGICNNCANYVAATFQQAGCCQQATPQACFASILEGAGANGGAAQLSTPASAPATITDPNFAACATALNVVSSCEAATSGFDNLNNAAEASCLCYDNSGNYAGAAFDDAWSGCVAYAQTADVSDYQTLSSGLGLCASAVGGGVQSTPATATGTGAAGTAQASGTTQAAPGTAAGSSNSAAVTATGSSVSSSSSSSAGSSTSGAMSIKGLGVASLLLTYCAAWWVL